MTEFYSIYIETGSSPLSGTRNDVEVKLFGSQNTTEYMELTSFDDIPWEKNQNRTFHLGKLNIGDLEAVEFRLKLQNDQKLDPLSESDVTLGPVLLELEKAGIFDGKFDGVLEGDETSDLESLDIDGWGLESFTISDGQKYFDTSELSGEESYLFDVNETKKFDVKETENFPGTVVPIDLVGGSNDIIDGTWFHVLDKGELDINNLRDKLGRIDQEQNTYFVTHGFSRGAGNSWIPENNINISNGERETSRETSLSKAIRQYDPNANILFVDWAEKNYKLDINLEALALNYAEARANLSKITDNIVEYITRYNVNPEKLTFVGHSLGAQIAGLVGQRVEMDRIIGLDPGGVEPFSDFLPDQPNARLSEDDAENVYVIHSETLYGYDWPAGDFDLYLNVTNYQDLGQYGIMIYEQPVPQEQWHDYAIDVAINLFEGTDYAGESKRRNEDGLAELTNLDIETFFDPNSYPTTKNSFYDLLNEKFPQNRALFFDENLQPEVDKSGDDIMRGSENDDSLNSGPGNDKIIGKGGNDTLNSGPGNDKIFGQSGDDYLIGRSGNDILLGGKGDDTLEGGIGRDRLNGGPGNDELIGGGSIDFFIFNTNRLFNEEDLGKDIITDFKVDQDFILLDKSTFDAIESDSSSRKNPGFSRVEEFEVVETDESAASSEAIIVHSTETGNLFYNQNGSASGFGTGGDFATVAPELSSENFILRV